MPTQNEMQNASMRFGIIPIIPLDEEWRKIDIIDEIRNHVFTDAEMHEICSIIENNKSITTADIISIMKLEYTSEEEFQRFKRAIDNIRNKKSHLKISNNYNI